MYKVAYESFKVNGNDGSGVGMGDLAGASGQQTAQKYSWRRSHSAVWLPHIQSATNQTVRRDHFDLPQPPWWSGDLFDPRCLQHLASQIFCLAAKTKQKESRISHAAEKWSVGADAASRC